MPRRLCTFWWQKVPKTARKSGRRLLCFPLVPDASLPVRIIFRAHRARRSPPGGGAGANETHIIGKTKCDEIKNEMRPSWRKAWSKRNATKISHTRKNTVRTTTKRCSNGIFLSQKQRSLRSLLVIANHPLLLSTTTRFRGTDGPLDAVDDPPVALGVSVDHIERKHRQHKLSLHCLE